MNAAPAFYEKIRLKAARRWEQLEQDLELAGPWYQLFQQVQSPRHVLSELLQNADDAGATEASVQIKSQIFIFEHNGEDFSEEQFASLCQFGYSNKRVLHTIGFRGIGFKSTFSLGDCVKLFTPSLSVCFYSKRFTEPHWLSEVVDTFGRTRITVEIDEPDIEKEVEENLREWLNNPVSLLFFKNLRRMNIFDQELDWRKKGRGPVSNSEWMVLNDDLNKKYLLIQSNAEAFPNEALIEIRKERMLHFTEEIEIPHCRIEIVLGVKGRLYVVLPTDIKTKLPFACNAPFVQDPARLKIKAPARSPTNRWMLERVGTLAASVMLDWLQQTNIHTVERSEAYDLFPDVDWDDKSPAGICGIAIERAFKSKIRSQAILLTEQGYLVQAKESIVIPQQLFDIWSAGHVVAFFDEEERPALCRHVERRNWKKLMNCGFIEQFDKERVLETLQAKHPPKPKSWRNLLNLWDYVAPEVTDYRQDVDSKNIRILPVQGKDILCGSSEIVRLGESKLLNSKNDWEFLSDYLIVLDPNWPRYLAKQRRKVSEIYSSSREETVRAAYAVLEKINMDVTSDVSKVIEQAAGKFFSNSERNFSLPRYVQLAQITAKLGAKIGNNFKFVTNDEELRSTSEGILFDADGSLRDLLPEQIRDSQTLHSKYTEEFLSCSRDDWDRWVLSGRACLHTFVPIVDPAMLEWCSPRDLKYTVKYEDLGLFASRRALDQELQIRGFEGTLDQRYSNPSFSINDRDFHPKYWEHWQSLEAERATIWGEIVERILSENETYWSSNASAQIIERARNGRFRRMTNDKVRPKWVLKLRNKKCLPDTRKNLCKPSDLFRRTRQTEPFINVENFVDHNLDNENTRAFLDLMGVQSTPAGPGRLLECLRALSKATPPPVHEVEKWYRRLDQMVNTCSTEDFKLIKQAFKSEKLILTQYEFWESTTAVSLSSDEEGIPEIPVIRTSVNELMLWRKIGVSDRPTDDLVIDWFKSLPKDKILAQEDKRRVRSLLTRDPIRVWEECGHWLNLAGEWVPVDSLSYSIAMQTLVHWRNLYPEIKKKTADLQRLPTEVTKNSPFRDLPSLATQIEKRFQRNHKIRCTNVPMKWLTLVGTALSRVQLDRNDDTEQVRKLANRLFQTKVGETPKLKIIPYIGGKPAGTPRNTEVLWLDNLLLYVNHLPKAKLARCIPEEIGKAFGRADIKAALDYSFKRSAQDVRDYLEENFNLAPASEIPEETENKTKQHPTDDHGVSKSDSGTNQEKIDSDRSEKIEEDDTQNTSTVVVEGEQDLDTVTPINKPRPSPKPAKLDIMERYAKIQGFQKNSDKKFFHRNGSWIARTSGELFPWEHRTADGDLVRYYLPKDHCLERKPLQVETDVWELVQRNSGSYAFILSDIEGNPVKVTDSHFCTMLDKDTITLYPATYRLVYND